MEHIRSLAALLREERVDEFLEYYDTQLGEYTNAEVEVIKEQALLLSEQADTTPVLEPLPAFLTHQSEDQILSNDTIGQIVSEEITTTPTLISQESPSISTLISPESSAAPSATPSVPPSAMPALHLSASPSWSSSSSDSSYVSTVTELAPDEIAVGTDLAFTEGPAEGRREGPVEGRKRKNLLPPPPPPPPVDTAEPSSISYADMLRKPQPFIFSESYSETDLLSGGKSDLLSGGKSGDQALLHNSCPDLTLTWNTTNGSSTGVSASTSAGTSANTSAGTNGVSPNEQPGFEIEFLNESSLSPQTVNCKKGAESVVFSSSCAESVVFSTPALDNRDSVRRADYLESKNSVSDHKVISDRSTISYTHSLHYSGSEKGYSAVGVGEGYCRDRKFVPKYREQRRGPITAEHQRLINYFSKEWRYIERITKKQVYKNSY